MARNAALEASHGLVVQSRDHDLCGGLLCWPEDRSHRRRNGYLLRTIGRVRNHSASDRTFQLLDPKPLIVARVHDVEVPSDNPKTHVGATRLVSA